MKPSNLFIRMADDKNEGSGVLSTDYCSHEPSSWGFKNRQFIGVNNPL